MGGNQSNQSNNDQITNGKSNNIQLKIPKNKNYNISYCTGFNIVDYSDINNNNSINLYSLINEFDNNNNNPVLVLIYVSFLYKLKNLGYSLIHNINK